MIKIKGLEKNYGKNQCILKNINLTIEDGGVTALLGHNGSGKSTLIKCLVGIIKPSKGEVTIDGKNSFKYRKKLVKSIGVLLNQKPSFITDLNVWDNFLFFKAIYEIEDAEFHTKLKLVDDYLHIKDLFEKPYRKLSFGERVKCEITSVLLHSPKYIILDEPTIGLDYNAKEGLYALLGYLSKEMKSTIIIITHEVDYIEKICDRAVILGNGEVKYDGIPQMIYRKVNDMTVVKIKYDYVKDEDKAKELFEKALEVDEKNRSILLRYALTEEREEYIRKSLDAFQVEEIGNEKVSLREVLEDVLKEIRVAE